VDLIVILGTLHIVQDFYFLDSDGNSEKDTFLDINSWLKKTFSSHILFKLERLKINECLTGNFSGYTLLKLLREQFYSNFMALTKQQSQIISRFDGLIIILISSTILCMIQPGRETVGYELIYRDTGKRPSYLSIILYNILYIFFFLMSPDLFAAVLLLDNITMYFISKNYVTIADWLLGLRRVYIYR
jgi:hypothetical protein